MKTKENELFIDKAYSKYQSLSKKDKSIINISLLILLIVFATLSIYTAGESFGEFLFHIKK